SRASGDQARRHGRVARVGLQPSARPRPTLVAKKHRIMCLRVDDDQGAELAKRAATCGVSVGEYLRRCALATGPAATTITQANVSLPAHPPPTPQARRVRSY